MEIFSTAEFAALVVGVVLPLLVGLVTRYEASAALRAVLLALLAAVTSVASEWADAVSAGTSFNWQTVVLSAIATFLVAVGVHFGLWKPTGVTEAVKSTGGFIGSKGE